MYYIVNATGATDGPHPAEWVRANAGPNTLISHGQQWVHFASHPDFRSGNMVRADTCHGCTIARQQGLSFCTTCGNPVVQNRGPGQSPSPHMAWLNLIMPGLAQIVFGQVVKGLVMLVVCIVALPTVVGWPVITVLTIIDAYKVGGKLRRAGAVGPWEMFPT